MLNPVNMHKLYWRPFETAPLDRWILAHGPGSIVVHVAFFLVRGERGWTDGQKKYPFQWYFHWWMPTPMPPRKRK